MYDKKKCENNNLSIYRFFRIFICFSFMIRLSNLLLPSSFSTPNIQGSIKIKFKKLPENKVHFSFDQF